MLALKYFDCLIPVRMLSCLIVELAFKDWRLKYKEHYAVLISFIGLRNLYIVLDKIQSFWAIPMNSSFPIFLSPVQKSRQNSVFKMAAEQTRVKMCVKKRSSFSSKFIVILPWQTIWHWIGNIFCCLAHCWMLILFDSNAVTELKSFRP